MQTVTILAYGLLSRWKMRAAVPLNERLKKGKTCKWMSSFPSILQSLVSERPPCFHRLFTIQFSISHWILNYCSLNIIFHLTHFHYLSCVRTPRGIDCVALERCGFREIADRRKWAISEINLSAINGCCSFWRRLERQIDLPFLFIKPKFWIIWWCADSLHPSPPSPSPSRSLFQAWKISLKELLSFIPNGCGSRGEPHPFEFIIIIYFDTFQVNESLSPSTALESSYPLLATEIINPEWYECRIRALAGSVPAWR